MRGNVITLEKFEGHYTHRDGQIPENGFRTLNNCEVTGGGTLRARNGFNHAAVVAKTDAAIVGRWRTVGSADYLVVKHSGGTSLIDTLTMGIDILLAGTPCDLLLQYNDQAYFFSSSANLTTYSPGLVVTAVTQRGTVGLIHKSRMFVTDNVTPAAGRSQVFFSEIMTAGTPPNVAGSWTATNFGSFQSSDGDWITAMAVLNDVLIVFKRFSTWAYYVEGEPPWTIRNVHPTIGCVGRDTAVVIGGLLYFMSANGIYRTDGTTMELISGNVEDDWDLTSAADAATTNMSSAVEYDGKYIINYANSNSLSVYGIDTGTWSDWVLPTAVSKLLSLPDYLPWEIRAWYYGTTQKCAKYSNQTTYVDKDATSYNMQVETKYTNFEKPELYKRVKEVALDFSVETTGPDLSASVIYTKDDSATVNAGTKTAIEDYTRRLIRFIGPGMCRFLQTAITIPVNQEIELNSISFDIVTRERVGRAR